MLRRHRLHAIEGECNLEIEWLLAPQGSVVIEDRDPIFGFDEVRAAGRRHAADKIDDALLRGTLVPGSKRSLPLDVLFGRQNSRSRRCRHGSSPIGLA
jgi:hypothetical protein